MLPIGAPRFAKKSVAPPQKGSTYTRCSGIRRSSQFTCFPLPPITRSGVWHSPWWNRCMLPPSTPHMRLPPPSGWFGSGAPSVANASNSGLSSAQKGSPSRRSPGTSSSGRWIAFVSMRINLYIHSPQCLSIAPPRGVRSDVARRVVASRARRASIIPAMPINRPAACAPDCRGGVFAVPREDSPAQPSKRNAKIPPPPSNTIPSESPRRGVWRICCGSRRALF